MVKEHLYITKKQFYSGYL